MFAALESCSWHWALNMNGEWGKKIEGQINIIYNEYVRGKYIMLDSAPWQRWGWSRSVSHSQIGNEAEDVLPAGTCTQSTHLHHIYTYIHTQVYTYLHIYVYIHGQPHGSQTDTQSTCMNTDSTKGLILLPSLAKWDRSRLENIYTHIYKCVCTVWIPLAAGLRRSAPWSQLPQLLAPGHMKPRGCNPTAIAGADRHACARARAHTHTEMPALPRSQ